MEKNHFAELIKKVSSLDELEEFIAKNTTPALSEEQVTELKESCFFDRFLKENGRALPVLITNINNFTQYEYQLYQEWLNKNQPQNVQAAACWDLSKILNMHENRSFRYAIEGFTSTLNTFAELESQIKSLEELRGEMGIFSEYLEDASAEIEKNRNTPVGRSFEKAPREFMNQVFGLYLEKIKVSEYFEEMPVAEAAAPTPAAPAIEEVPAAPTTTITPSVSTEDVMAVIGELKKIGYAPSNSHEAKSLFEIVKACMIEGVDSIEGLLPHIAEFKQDSITPEEIAHIKGLLEQLCEIDGDACNRIHANIVRAYSSIEQIPKSQVGHCAAIIERKIRAVLADLAHSQAGVTPQPQAQQAAVASLF